MIRFSVNEIDWIGLQGRSVRGDLKGLLALHPDSFVVNVVITAVVLSSVLNQVSSF